ncbi:hypothetical protein D3C71_1611390 [compost metagenome]
MNVLFSSAVPVDPAIVGATPVVSVVSCLAVIPSNLPLSKAQYPIPTIGMARIIAFIGQRSLAQVDFSSMFLFVFWFY